MRNLCLILILSCSLFGRTHDLIIKSNQRTYEVSVQTKIEHWGMGTSQTDLFLAYLSSNEYQECQEATIDSLGELTNFGAGEQCIYYNVPLGRNKKFGKRAVFNNLFVLETYDISTDFSLLNEVPEYDVEDPTYQQYTGSNFPFINVENQELNSVSEILWNQSEDIVEYARNCYLYVASYFEFADPESGFKSLDYTLFHKKGDCGNLSSVFISLLRIKGIPARHLMGFRPDGSLHVWADFYVQDHGWIPVDVTYKCDYPQGDYFGKIKFEHNGFIVQRGIGHEVSVLESRKRITGLQTYTYQVSYSKRHHAKVYIDRKVRCTEKI